MSSPAFAFLSANILGSLELGKLSFHQFKPNSSAKVQNVLLANAGCLVKPINLEALMQLSPLRIW